MTMSYQEIMDCNVWMAFCKRFGVSEWAVNEGGGDCTHTFTLAEAREIGIIKA